MEKKSGGLGFRYTVALLLVLAMGASVLFGVGFGVGEVHKSVSAFTPDSLLIYREYDANGDSLTPNLASAEKRELGYITCDALYGTYGELICNPPNSLTEVYFEIKFAPAIESGEFVFRHIVDAEGEIEITDDNNSILWHYGEVGVYKVIVFVETFVEDDESGELIEAEPETFEYLFVGKSGLGNLGAFFGKSNMTTYANYKNFSGSLELSPVAGQNYQLPEGTQFVISNVLSPFEYELSESGIVLIIHKSKNVGEYPVTFDVTYKCMVIDDFGMIESLAEHTETLTAVLNFKERPKNNSLVEALLGLLVLGVLGGAVFGITYMSKRMQEKQDTVRMK